MEKAIKAQTPAFNLADWDVFFLGGASILACLGVLLLVDRSSVYVASKIAFGLAFAINHPHFLSSYMLLYGDFRKNIFSSWRYMWSAIGAPVLLAGILIYSFASGNTPWIGHTLNAMFFLVGWHYVKQVFGCVIVTSARRRIFYQPMERKMILANLFSLWALSFSQGQIGSGSFQFYGITYSGLGFSRAILPFLYFSIAATFVAMAAMHVRKYKRERTLPSAPGIAALATLYVWYLPAFSHPAYAYFIPMFHSLQYLVFVWSFKKNQVAATPDSKWMRDFAGYAAMALMLGAISFEFLPKFLDSQKLLHNPALGTSPFLAGILIFINIHHYFIDNTIWRNNNEQVKKYLFAPTPKAANQTPPAKARELKAA